jgi:hypothetical protein
MSYPVIQSDNQHPNESCKTKTNVHSSSEKLGIHSDHCRSQPNNDEDPGEDGDLLIWLSPHTQNTTEVIESE